MPVLSVQMAEVQPSVSTADNRLTMAFWAAILRDARARDSVTNGNRPEPSKRSDKLHSQHPLFVSRLTFGDESNNHSNGKDGAVVEAHMDKPEGKARVREDSGVG